MRLRVAKAIYNAVHCGGAHGPCHNWQQITVAARLVERALRRRSRLVAPGKLNEKAVAEMRAVLDGRA